MGIVRPLSYRVAERDSHTQTWKDQTMIRKLTALPVVLALTACATIIHGSTQPLGVSSSPTNATVTVDKMNVGNTPVIAKLKRGDNHTVAINMDGYTPFEATVTKKVSGWVWGNIVFGGLIGLAVDAMTGGLYNLTPEQLTAQLAKQNAGVAPTKDGIYVILVKHAETGWQKVGQLTPVPVSNTAVGE
jgi:hypothetical protein